MNNKGFATLGIALSVLIITTIMIAGFSSPMLNTAKNVKNAEEDTLQYTKNIAAKERLFSKLNENVSYDGLLDYEDLGVKYNVEEINLINEPVSIFINGSGGEFQIINATDVNISLSAVAINPEEEFSYSAELLYNDVNEPITKVENLTTSKNINIEKGFFYDKNSDKTKYGTYKLNLIGTNASVSAKVSYDRLEKREVNLTELDDKEIIENIIIEYDENVDRVSVYYNKSDSQ